MPGYKNNSKNRPKKHNPNSYNAGKTGGRPARGKVKTARSRHGKKVKINC